jgi:hypothetical protein
MKTRASNAARADVRRVPHDPKRWIAAGLVALALLAIGAMNVNFLVMHKDKTLIDALLQTGGFLLVAAIPIAYLVHKVWFAENLALPIGGWHSDLEDSGDDEFNVPVFDPDSINTRTPVYGFHYSDYGNFNLVDDV